MTTHAHRPGRRRAPASASSVIRPLLRAPTRTTVAEVVFPGAVHFADPDTHDILLAVVANDAVVHPHAAVLAPWDGWQLLTGLVRGQRILVGDGRVTLPDADVEVTRWWSPRPVLGEPSAARCRAARRTLRTSLTLRDVHVPEREQVRLALLVEALSANDVAAATSAAHRLLGLGAGSTPTGDDLLAGLFSTVARFGPSVDGPPTSDVGATEERGARIRGVHQVAAEVVAAAPTATTSLSAALLRHAADGEVCRPAGRLLIALARQLEEVAVRAAVDGLLAVGSSSGRDLAYGILAGLDVLIGDAHRTPHVIHRPTLVTGRA